ncbi:RsmB/NOP family class I SAM-dependent RNA methyltransferase [Chitiniphilus purpureus]|uniref:RsmB/NOP family class I SAM-dependent RNA methyltransferase n=1 Tax=Chitiniphilus purpureus TaxID=2981137 RepID=A0ABY6DQ98_9NEIS|nr:RsmB/NOP family class I SAM-dependent RNA methyltransferase [Chitiniphilus sp. CD1]UXY15261.1 RsmB/NOP family class I SAM-dependent RNA methyltransferase [Chitiniphilus sp. CD1]
MINTIQYQAILDALEQILPFTAPADVCLSRLFREQKRLGARDRAVVAETVFGLLRHLPRLEWLAGPYAGARLWLLAYLSAIEKRNLKELAGIFNEEQLALARQWKATDWSVAPLHVRAGLPDWVVQALQGQGRDEESILRLGNAMLASAPLDLRVNLLKARRDAVLGALNDPGAELKAEPTPYSPWGVRMAGKPALNRHPLFLDGSIEVQDEGSQLLALLTGARRGQMVADFCAGAGGKTLAIGAMMQNTGRLYAFDISEKRLANLKPRLARSGLSNVQPQLLASEHDQKVKRLAGKMDAVLVDAPCSGLGTLRRNPDLKYRQSAQSVAELNAKQASILASAARLVKSGGRLVYATCSILQSENQAIVEALLATQPEFTLLDVRTLLAEERVALDLDGPLLQLTPEQHGTDGFFAAVLQRN